MNKWDYPAPYTITQTVEDAHIDGLQHTNNTVYVKWCEQIAWAHSQSLGMDLACYQRLNRAMAITKAEYHYLRASRANDKLTIATWLVNWDAKLTMERRFQIIREHDGQTILRGVMHFACIELSTGKPRRLPKEFIEGYGAAVLNL